MIGGQKQAVVFKGEARQQRRAVPRSTKGWIAVVETHENKTTTATTALATFAVFSVTVEKAFREYSHIRVERRTSVFINQDHDSCRTRSDGSAQAPDSDIEIPILDG